MASSESQQHIPNPAPPSLSAGGHEMHNYPAAQDASRPPSQQEPYLTPYLGLRARLSQTWINRWTVLLLLVLIRTLFAIASLDNNLGTARREALSACTSVENVGSAMASMPYYMSQGVNDLSAKGLEKAISGLMEMLILTITGVEEIVLFIINLMTSTYVCLITFAVGGSLHVAVDIAKDVGNFLNATAQDVGKDLGSAAGDFQNAMNSFLKDLEKLGSVFTDKDYTPPTIDLTSEINKLNGLQLPSDYDQNLATLNNSIPTFAQVHNLTNRAIEFPFEEVKKLLNESLPRYTMNSSLFPVPDKQQLTFCSGNDGVNDFFDGLVELEHLAKKVFLIVIVILAILAMIPMAWYEARRYRSMKERAELVRSDAFDSMDAVYIASRPYTSLTGLRVANLFSCSRRRALIRWTIAYATTVPALFILSLALAGLLGCLCQYVLLKSIEKEAPILENQVIGFADKVINALNNASEQWAVGTNHIINDTNTKVNEDVFGWVNTTTSAVNNTLNVLVDGMVGVLNETFGGTILYEPILDVLNCLLLLKIQGIESGLTWVQDHAHIDFPMLQNDTFSLGTIQKVSGSKSDILATGPNGTATDAITSTIYHVTNFMEDAIRQEAIIASCLLLIWLIIAVIGISRALFLLYKGYDLNGTPRSHPSNDIKSVPVSREEEKFELHQFAHTDMAKVPTYEQATGNPPPDLRDNAANRYHGHTYTLTPRPVPDLHIEHSTPPILHTGFHHETEKLGNVSGQNVDSAIRRPTHIRASSHGDYEITSPNSANPRDPFSDSKYLSTEQTKPNPFVDPGR